MSQVIFRAMKYLIDHSIDSLKKAGFLLVVCFCIFQTPVHSQQLSDSGLYLIPYPQKVELSGERFMFDSEVSISLDKNATKADHFAANELIADLKNEFNITAVVSGKFSARTIKLTRRAKTLLNKPQRYNISVTPNLITISAAGEDGLFYGTQSLLQLINMKDASPYIIGMRLDDWPEIPERAIHYDTKHHQDKYTYVQKFIKELARYKVNILVWEWEDKFEYPSHPEIGAPGAFTTKEIQSLTDYARNYHVEIVPLIQGLGHASFILKWPQYRQLREIDASNFEFCPLKDGTYKLLFDLWKDAMDATKGSRYIHVGSDETFELGQCMECAQKAKEIGTKGLYHHFSNKAANFIVSNKRQPMIWESPMGWKSDKVAAAIAPNKNLVLTEEMGSGGTIERVIQAKKLGFRSYFYDPNPGIEPVFLPYMYSETDERVKVKGCLENSFTTLREAAASGAYDGMIRTSWDDAGLHNQQWMLSFATAAAFSWNSKVPGLESFTNTFFKNYYGVGVAGMKELFTLLNEGAYFYWDSFERKIWHFGEIGKTHLPDLPRGDALEYDPFWSTQHKNMIGRAHKESVQMDRALSLINTNKKLAGKNYYDFELFETVADLIKHTACTYITLSSVEQAIKKAHEATFVSKDSATLRLKEAENLLIENIGDRKKVMDKLVKVWEETRLEKGMSLPGKKYFFQQDRTRHFANRTPDMRYLIYDEERLDIDGYLSRLRDYIQQYEKQLF